MKKKDDYLLFNAKKATFCDVLKMEIDFLFTEKTFLHIHN
jgi:hypothetical protein